MRYRPGDAWDRPMSLAVEEFSLGATERIFILAARMWATCARRALYGGRR